MPPNWLIAPLDRSIMRPPVYGPLSLILTTTERPLLWLVTRTLVPSGKVLDAAVMAYWLKVSPLAVLRPWNPGPYQEALPQDASAGMWRPTTIVKDIKAVAIILFFKIINRIQQLSLFEKVRALPNKDCELGKILGELPQYQDFASGNFPRWHISYHLLHEGERDNHLPP